MACKSWTCTLFSTAAQNGTGTRPILTWLVPVLLWIYHPRFHLASNHSRGEPATTWGSNQAARSARHRRASVQAPTIRHAMPADVSDVGSGTVNAVKVPSLDIDSVMVRSPSVVV